MADDLVSTFDELATLDAKASHIFELLIGNTGVDENLPLLSAGRCLASQIDQHAKSRKEPPYHGAQHFCEALLVANFLCLIHALEGGVRLEVLIAVLAHDLFHDGKPNGPTPFRMERLSSNALLTHLRASGVPESIQRRIVALVLATEVSFGVKLVQSCHAHHVDGADRPSIPSAAPELCELVSSALLTRMALIVCEADILPSVGLTVDYALILQDRLASEWNMSLDLKDKLDFLNVFVSPLIVGRFFQPNVEKLRNFLIEHLDDSFSE